MRAHSVLVVCAVLLLLGACSTRPPAAAPQALPVSGAWSREHAPSPAASWWQAWNDGQLDALIAKALADNPDSALVAARITQARAAQAAARAAGSPSVTLNAGAERQRVARRLRLPAEDGSPPRAVRRRFELEALAAYELDWLGRKTIAVAGARAQSVAAEHDAAAARIALICAVVEAYADIALAEKQVALADAQAGLGGEAEAAEQRRLSAGLSDQRRLRGRQDVWSRAAQAIDDATRQRKQAIDRLALLLGQPAHRFAAPVVNASLLEQPLALQADQPADVVGRRPDVQAAWQRLLAATADAERAHLERYPRITLSAASGLLSESLSRWLRSDALGWVLGIRAGVSLFDGGRLQAQADQAQALSQERQAEYRKTVLAALQEAESAFVQFEFTRASLEQTAAATQRRLADERNVRSELAAGRAGRIVVLDAGRATLEARDELLRAQRAHLQSYVLLRRVLADGA